MTFHITDEVLKQVEALAAQGLSQEQIGSVIGCGRETIRRRKNDNEAFEAALKRGKCKGVAKVTNALFQNAVNGNLGAQVFFLKNRDGENWKDNKAAAAPVEFKLTRNLKPHERANEVLNAISNGVIPPDIGAMLIQSVKSTVDIEEFTDLKERIESLEKLTNGG